MNVSSKKISLFHISTKLLLVCFLSYLCRSTKAFWQISGNLGVSLQRFAAPTGMARIDLCTKYVKNPFSGFFDSLLPPDLQDNKADFLLSLGDSSSCESCEEDQPSRFFLQLSVELNSSLLARNRLEDPRGVKFIPSGGVAESKLVMQGGDGSNMANSFALILCGIDELSVQTKNFRCWYGSEISFRFGSEFGQNVFFTISQRCNNWKILLFPFGLKYPCPVYSDWQIHTGSLCFQSRARWGLWGEAAFSSVDKESKNYHDSAWSKAGWRYWEWKLGGSWRFTSWLEGRVGVEYLAGNYHAVGRFCFKKKKSSFSTNHWPIESLPSYIKQLSLSGPVVHDGLLLPG